MSTVLATSLATAQPTTAALVDGPRSAPLRRLVLEAFRSVDWQRAAAIPAPWPLLPAHVGAAVDALWRDRLLERSADPRAGGATARYRLSPAGRAALDAAG